MYEILLIAATIGLMWMYRDNNEYVTIYSGDETTLGEANEYYWILKHHKIHFKYQIPYNWENIFLFGYKKSPVYIKVRKDDAARTREIFWFYRAEKMKMEENIKQ